MAGDWIAMRLDLYEDPSVIQMAESLGIREEYVVGLLHKVWSWASRQCHGGSVTNVTLMSLERVTNVTGFTTAMRDAGWIEESADDSGRPIVVFPKWENWLSNSAKERLQASKRQQKKRKNGKSTSGEDVTHLSRQERDKNVTTEQNRREEKSNKKEKLGDRPISSFLANADFRDRWETYKEVSESRHNWTIGGMQEQTALAEIERDCKTVEVALGILDATIAAGSKHPHRVSAKRQPAMAGTSRRTNLD